jgi:cytochrome c-type protein NapB
VRSARGQALERTAERAVTSQRPDGTRRALNIALACVAAVALAGFLTGTREAPTPGGYRSHGSHVAAARVAPRAADVETARYAERRAQQALALTRLASAPRTPTDEVVLSASAYDEAVAVRGAGRAYDGAPPTIPHAIDQRGAPACLACHENGMSVEGKVAPVMSHASFSSCLQCHTSREAGPPGALLAPSIDTSSSFAGLVAAGRGERAWPGAPPQMPHRSFMRERCVSCHGVWATGLASSHPHRQNCRQCHEPAAGTDQVPRSTFAPLGGLGEVQR